MARKKYPELEIEKHEPVKKSDRWLARFGYFSLGIIFMALSVLAYWSVSGNDVLSVEGTPTVVPLVAKSEETVTVYVNYCKPSAIEGRLVKRLVTDNTELFTPTGNESFPVGCHSDYPVEVPIPAQTASGIYVVNFRITYKTNPLKTVVEDFSSERFEIINDVNDQL